MSDAAKLEAYVKQLHQRLTVQNINYFELLGLPKTATHKEIEAAYQKYAQFFSEARINALTDPQLRKMGQFVLEKINRAHEILTNYDKKADYEKRGFREYTAELDQPDEEPTEKARNLYKKAKTLQGQKDFPNAIKLLEEAVKLDPKVPSYFLLLGICQTPYQSQIQQAERNLQKAIDMENWNAEAYVAMGNLFYTHKFHKRAEIFYRKALQLDNRHALAKKRLDEIAEPEKTIVDKVHGALKYALPSVFGRKNKK